MPSGKPTDEILAALPEVGLRLWILADNGVDWYAVVNVPAHPTQQWHANAPTAVDALIGALKSAGVDVSDE